MGVPCQAAALALRVWLQKYSGPVCNLKGLEAAFFLIVILVIHNMYVVSSFCSLWL